MSPRKSGMSVYSLALPLSRNLARSQSVLLLILECSMILFCREKFHSQLASDDGGHDETNDCWKMLTSFFVLEVRWKTYRKCKPFEIKSITRRQRNKCCQAFNACRWAISVVWLIMSSDIMRSNPSQNRKVYRVLRWIGRPRFQEIVEWTMRGRYGRSTFHFLTRQTADSDLSDRRQTFLHLWLSLTRPDLLGSSFS
jgi:hypothetical protein